MPVSTLASRTQLVWDLRLAVPVWSLTTKWECLTRFVVMRMRTFCWLCLKARPSMTSCGSRSGASRSRYVFVLFVLVFVLVLVFSRTRVYGRTCPSRTRVCTHARTRVRFSRTRVCTQTCYSRTRPSWTRSCGRTLLVFEVAMLAFVRQNLLHTQYIDHIRCTEKRPYRNSKENVLQRSLTVRQIHYTKLHAVLIYVLLISYVKT